MLTISSSIRVGRLKATAVLALPMAVATLEDWVPSMRCTRIAWPAVVDDGDHHFPAVLARAVASQAAATSLAASRVSDLLRGQVRGAWRAPAGGLPADDTFGRRLGPLGQRRHRARAPLVEAVDGVEELVAEREELAPDGGGSMRRERVSRTGAPTVSESLRSRQETVGWASDSSSAARVTLPWRTQASKATSWGKKPCRK